MPQRHTEHLVTVTLATNSVGEDESVCYKYQINYRKMTLFLHCSFHHIIVFKATLLQQKQIKLDTANMSPLCMKTTQLNLEGRSHWLPIVVAEIGGTESMASDCYSHDKKGLQSHLINLLWNRMSHWHFKLPCCFVHRIILSLNSLSF